MNEVEIMFPFPPPPHKKKYFITPSPFFPLPFPDPCVSGHSFILKYRTSHPLPFCFLLGRIKRTLEPFFFLFPLTTLFFPPPLHNLLECELLFLYFVPLFFLRYNRVHCQSLLPPPPPSPSSPLDLFYSYEKKNSALGVYNPFSPPSFSAFSQPVQSRHVDYLIINSQNFPLSFLYRILRVILLSFSPSFSFPFLSYPMPL